MRRKRDPNRKEVAGTHGEAAGASGAKHVAPAVPSKPRTEAEEAENQRALDEAAGVAPVRSSLAPPPVARPANAMPLINTDTREKLLYKIACAGTPLGDEFFKQFPDMQEILSLALSISVRLCVVAICNGELAPTQRIACMRLVAALNGKQLPAEEEPASRPAPPFSIPTCMGDVNATLDKIRDLSKAS